MRVSTATRFDAAIDSLQQRQRDMAEAQQAMTNGKRINRPSDDPTGAARAERAYITGARVQSSQRSVDASRAAMALAESALGQAGNLLQDARETLVAAGNGSYSPAERLSQANALQSLRGQLLAVANQGNGAGGWLFGGQGATGQPFLDAPGGVQPAGSGGQTVLSSTEQMPTTVDGRAIWLQVRTGNGVFATAADAANTGSGWINAGSVTDPGALTDEAYSIEIVELNGAPAVSVLRNGQPTALENQPYRSGETLSVDGMSFTLKGSPAVGDRFTIRPSTPDLDVFSALDRAIATLRDPAANAGQVAQAVNAGIRDMDAVIGHMGAARAEVGATMNRLDALDGRNQDRALWAKTVQSDTEDLDMLEAVSTFQNRQTGYQAALQSYAMVQKLSLFDFVKA